MALCPLKFDNETATISFCIEPEQTEGHAVIVAPEHVQVQKARQELRQALLAKDTNDGTGTFWSPGDQWMPATCSAPPSLNTI